MRPAAIPPSSTPPPLSTLPDGTPFYGAIGELAYDPDEDRVQCHLCGEWFRQIGGHHLIRRHGWTIDEYRLAFRLPKRVSTCARGLTALKSRLVAHLEPFQAPGRFKTDPDTARQAARSSGVGRVIRSVADTRPELVAQWHPSRNRGLSPAAVGMASTEPIWWLCQTCGHEWQTSVESRRKDAGCPACLRERQRLQPQLYDMNARQQATRAAANPLTAHPELIAEWHPTRNDGLDPATLARGSHRRVWWRCSTCGYDWQTPVYWRTYSQTRCPNCQARHKRGRAAATA